MKRNCKHILAVAVTFMLSIGGLWAVGAGVQLGLNPSIKITSQGADFNSIEGSAVGSIRCSRLPLSFGFGISFIGNNSNLALGGTGFIDYFAIDNQVNNNFNLYSGFGIGNSFSFTTKREIIDYVSPRFFVGLNWLFYDNFIELFIQQNICPGAQFNITKKETDFVLSMPFEIGARWHF